MITTLLALSSIMALSSQSGINLPLGVDSIVTPLVKSTSPHPVHFIKLAAVIEDYRRFTKQMPYLEHSQITDEFKFNLDLGLTCERF
jgi:hypothetical protein